MNSKEIQGMAIWASEVANKHNKSITYVLMMIHEAMSVESDTANIKSSVINKLEVK